MKKNISFVSTDGKTPIHCQIWQADELVKPQLILQIIHGMAEYIDRYDSFAQFLIQYNIMVIGHDHLGHGQSLDQERPLLGYFGEQKSDQLLIDDAFQVTTIAKKKYPGVPLIVMGHSMGSFVLRNYLPLYGQQIAGAIIMGTGHRQPELKLALPLAKLLNQAAPKKVNPRFDKLAFGHFSQLFPEKRTAFDWLSKNQENVDTYIADPKMGFIFTNNGFYTLFNLMSRATATSWFEGMPKSLPLLIISGEKDPVGKFGKGPRAVAKELTLAGFGNVSLRLYTDLRHELLNEVEKELVMTDIYHWLVSHF